MNYVRDEYVQHEAPSVPFPPAFTSLMKALEGRLKNLDKPDSERAQGIIDNVRRYNRCTEKQEAEIKRLEEKSKRKQRERRERPKKFYGYRDGATWISPREAERLHDAEVEHERKYDCDPVYRAQHDRHIARKGVLLLTLSDQFFKPEREKERDMIRFGLRHYFRSEDLRIALPGILQPHLKDQRQLMACLLGRLRMLRAEGLPSTMAGVADAKQRIYRVRVCIAAEGSGILRDRVRRRMIAAELGQ